MLNKLNTRLKLNLLFFGGAFFFVLIYNLSLTKTFSCYTETKVLEEKLKAKETLPKRIKVLEAEFKDYSPSNDSSDLENQQEELLNLVSNYCNQNSLLLKDFPKGIKGNESTYEICTQRFSIEGAFIPAIKLCNLLEKESKYGRVCSVNFLLQKDIKTGLESLLTTFYVQSVLKKDKK